jgi:hypothetical protein
MKDWDPTYIGIVPPTSRKFIPAYLYRHLGELRDTWGPYW